MTLAECRAGCSASQCDGGVQSSVVHVCEMVNCNGIVSGFEPTACPFVPDKCFLMRDRYMCLWLVPGTNISTLLQQILYKSACNPVAMLYECECHKACFNNVGQTVV